MTRLANYILTSCILATCLAGGPPAPPAPPVHKPIVNQPTVLVEALTKVEQKCHIEEVELYAEVCTPTIEKDCHKVRVKSRKLETREDCVDVIRTVCEETEEVVDNEVCYYIYNKESQDTEATTVAVDYEVKCEEEAQNICSANTGYGYSSACKNQKMDICYNVPKVRPDKTSVTVSFPVPEKKCENKPVKIPKISCDEVEDKKCFQLPYTVEEEEELEKCTTRLGPPKCEQTPVTLPKQICVDIQHVPAPVPHPAPLHQLVHPIQHASFPFLG